MSLLDVLQLPRPKGGLKGGPSAPGTSERPLGEVGPQTRSARPADSRTRAHHGAAAGETAKPAARFEPVLSASGLGSWNLHVGEEIEMILTITNWASAPRGTRADWRIVPTSPSITVFSTRHAGLTVVRVKGNRAGPAKLGATVTLTGPDGSREHAFPDLAFAVDAPAAVMTPNGGVDAASEGGLATESDLLREMGELLLNWQTWAIGGARDFAEDELAKRIDGLESGSRGAFLLALLGNVTWAATVFVAEGATIVTIGQKGIQFGLSLAGIGAAAAPTLPMDSESALGVARDAILGRVAGVYAKLKPQLAPLAKNIVENGVGISLNRALTLFVLANFADCAVVDRRFHSAPTLNTTLISRKYREAASARLRLVKSAAEVADMSEAFAALGLKVTDAQLVQKIAQDDQSREELGLLAEQIKAARPAERRRLFQQKMKDAFGIVVPDDKLQDL